LTYAAGGTGADGARGSAIFGNRTDCPHAGQTYSLSARWRSGVRHFGQGIGFALTYAAKSSWDRRSSIPPGSAFGSGGAGVTSATVGAVPLFRASRDEESRPHCGQTARLSVPVDWSGTWQCGQSVFSPTGVNTGDGARGARTGSGIGDAAGVESVGGGGGAGAAQRTRRRLGSYRMGVQGRASSCARSFSALRSRTESAAASPGTLVVPRDCTADRRRSRSCCEGPKRATIARSRASRTKNLSFHAHEFARDG